MIINNLLLASESYTHTNWEFHNVNVRFSRLYYIIDGEAYYKENGQTVRFKKGHLYLTPVYTPFDLYENPSDKLTIACYNYKNTLDSINHPLINLIKR